MDKKIVVTISREYGSGGREIGRMVAERLGFSFYDREILALACEKSGLSVNFAEDIEQKIKNKFLHNITFGGYIMGADLSSSQLSLPDKLFVATCEIIRSLADEGNCVIVGRCADYVLKDNEGVINIFVYADIEHKAERIAKRHNIDLSKATAESKKFDKYRKNHYDYYTEREWGDRENYHLCLNSGFLGIEKTVDIIVDAVKEYTK